MVSNIFKSPQTRRRLRLGRATPVDGRNVPTESSRSPIAVTTAEQTQSQNDWQGDKEADDEDGDEEEGFGDDFDDFAEGEEGDDEDFGDFDEGFTAPVGGDPATTPSLPTSQPGIVSRQQLLHSRRTSSNAHRLSPGATLDLFSASSSSSPPCFVLPDSTS